MTPLYYGLHFTAFNCEVGCSNVFVYSGVEIPKHWSIVLLVFNLSDVLTTCILQNPHQLQIFGK